ncbi:MAG: type II toxin-antitoxin system Phd/YefM family antitoxin [bacterium]|nr:type II toxin-antitoxin system Phd/YefM family antitoxin [bacterium]
MKTISASEATVDITSMLDSAQVERVVITRNGKPSAVVLGLESYDAEDMNLASSPEFWQMIEQRRRGSSIPLAEVRARLDAKQRSGF